MDLVGISVHNQLYNTMRAQIFLRIFTEISLRKKTKNLMLSRISKEIKNRKLQITKWEINKF